MKEERHQCRYSLFIYIYIAFEKLNETKKSDLKEIKILHWLGLWWLVIVDSQMEQIWFSWAEILELASNVNISNFTSLWASIFWDNNSENAIFYMGLHMFQLHIFWQFNFPRKAPFPVPLSATCQIVSSAFCSSLLPSPVIRITFPSSICTFMFSLLNPIHFKNFKKMKTR